MGDREACDECELKCSLIHGNKTDPSPLVTSFIKILFGRYDVSKDLCLPQKISKAIPVLVAGENYILEDTNGQQWEVKLGTKDGLLAFKKGWTKFYEDHGLRVGYVLTFHYIRSSYFVVQIFDTTGFEKLKFPVATGKKRKRSEIEGNCNTVGECPDLSDHSAKKEGAAFSDTYQHVASANCDTEQIYMINRDNGYNYEEDRSPLLNLAKSELQFRVDPDGGSDSKHRPSNTSAESDAVAGILNEKTVSAKVVSSERPAEVISPTLSKNINSKRANVAGVDNDHHGDHSYVPPIENKGPSSNLLDSELQFRVYPDGGSGSRPHPSSTSAQSDAVAGNLNENTVSSKVVSREPPAEVAAPTLSNNITPKKANVAEVDSDHHGDHPYVPPIDNQIQVPSECWMKSPTTSSKRFSEKAVVHKKHSESDAVSGDFNENTVSAKVVGREPPAEAAAPTLSNNISYRANVAEVYNDHHGGHPHVPATEYQGQVPSECRIKSSTMSSKRVIEKAAEHKEHSGLKGTKPGSDSIPRPSNISAEDAVAGILNEKTVLCAKVVNSEPPAEVISHTLSKIITSKRANVAEVDNDHHGDDPYVPPIENQGPLLNLLDYELQFGVYLDGVSGSRPHPSSTLAHSGAVAGNLNENTVSAKVASREPPAEVAAPTLSNNVTSNRVNLAEVDNDHHGDNPYVPPTENQSQVPSECRIKSPIMSSKRVIEKAAGRRKHSEKQPKRSRRSALTFDGVEKNNGVRRLVKTKHVDLVNDNSLEASGFSFTAIIESHENLKLPASVKFWDSVEKKVVNLQGPNGVVWPVLYCNELGIKALTSGWENFYRSCRLRKGDKCVFRLEDEAKTIFRVDVTQHRCNGI